MPDAVLASALLARDLAPVIAHHPDPAFLFDTTGVVLAVNPPLCAWLGHTSHELIGFAFDPMIAPHALPDVRAQFEVAASGSSVRFRVATQHRGRADVTAELTISPIIIEGIVVALLGFAVDSAASDERDHEARARRELLTTAGRLARFGGWAIDLTTGVLSLTSDARAMLGWDPSSSIGLDEALLLIPEPDRSIVGPLFQQCLVDGQILEVTTALISRTGEHLRVRFIAEPERDARGVVSRVHGAIWVISADERARVSATLAQRRAEQQAELLENARDAMIVRDLENRVVYWNRAAERIYGWSAEEAIGRPVDDLVCGDGDALKNAMRELLETGVWFGELVQRTRDGRELVMDCRWQIIVDADGAPASIFAVNTDITEYTRDLEARVRNMRMESLGTLAGGIAHDLNNVLTPILMSVQLLGQSEADPARIELLNGMETAVTRGANMIRQVLAYARGVEVRRVTVRTEHLLHDAFAFARDTLPRTIEIDVDLDSEIADSTGDATQLMQVLTNLITNAADSMPDGGRLRLSAENRQLDAPDTTTNALVQPGAFVVISVEDTGHGMSAETMDKIFEPFFTTKIHGRGTGLGLATSIAIVRSHGGLLRVESEPGLGTRFEVSLPAVVDRTIPTPSPAPRSATNPRGNQELVLVVDDEPIIQQVTRQTLEDHGYRTVVAANGRDAIDIIESADVMVDLVITDMMMPVMDGAETTAYLEHHHPSIPIIAASGFMSSGAISQSAGMGVSRFLAKPYTASQLINAVHATLHDTSVSRRDQS